MTPVSTVEHYWRRLTLLIQQFMNYTQYHNVISQIFPQGMINPAADSDSDDFEKIDVEADFPKQRKTQKEKNKPWRILTFQDVKYVVGKERPEGKGKQDAKKHTHDPILCQHPLDMMRARGGRDNLLWWNCQACGTSWDRIPLSKFEATSDSQSNHKDRVTFGKHAGKTYDEVYKKHPSYCMWVMQTAEVGDDPDASLVKFARHLATREARSPEDVPAGRMDEEL
jgi:hypothetical protein